MGDITLREALDEYRNVYMAYRNFAERTREEYQNDIEGFIEFLEKSEVTRAREIGLPIVERFIADLEHRGFASLTRKRKVVSVRSFLLFLYQDGYIDMNIAKLVVLPFTENTVPKILTRTEYDRLREACSNNRRDRAIVELLLQTGIKLSELTRLNLNDIEFKKAGEKVTGFVRIAGGRGTKSRLIQLDYQTCISLKGYLHVRGDTRNQPLFLNRFGEPLGARGVQKIIKKLFRILGIQWASVHTLRHTFGIRQLTLGTDSKTLRKVMGLADDRSIANYVSLAHELRISGPND